MRYGGSQGPSKHYVRIGFTKDEREKIDQAIQKVSHDGCSWINNYAAAGPSDFIRHLVHFAVKRILEDKSPDAWLQKRINKVGYHLTEMQWAADRLRKAANEIPNLKLPQRRKTRAA